MSFPRYPKYKPSGIDWLGAVPEHWEIKRFKYIFKEREERSTDGSELLLSVSAYTGVSPRSEVIDEGDHLSRAESLEGYKVCRKDDLVMNIMLAWNRGLAFTNYDGIVSPAYCVFDVINGSLPRFLDYLVRSNEYTLYYKAFSSGVIDSRLRLYPDTFGSLSCGLPPLPEQTQIANFLDRETAKIDALVSEQRRLIELLKEKRQAVISHAVTRGLNPSAPLKPSGIDWLGDVPAHWEIGPLKRLINTIESGTSVNASDEPATENELGVLKTSCVYTGEFRPEENKTVVKEELERVTCPLKPGALIVSRMNTPELIGFAGFVRSAPTNIFLPDRLWQITFKNSSAQFVHYWTRTDIYRGQVETECTGTSASMKNLAQDQFTKFIIPIPPPTEQTAIVRHLDAETAKFDALTAEAERAVTLLQERRTALISAAVTGQIDVCGLNSKFITRVY